MSIDRSIFQIDKDRLDEACFNQADLMYEHSEHLAECKRDLEAADRRLRVAKAEGAKRIRRSPSKYGMERATDKGIEMAVEALKSVNDIQDEIAQLKHEVNIYQAAVTALDHRKRMLETLQRLHGQGYFAIPVRVLEPAEDRVASRRAAHQRKKKRSAKKRRPTKKKPRET